MAQKMVKYTWAGLMDCIICWFLGHKKKRMTWQEAHPANSGWFCTRCKHYKLKWF